jgi:soluble lytic murein transglycosylase-like protein
MTPDVLPVPDLYRVVITQAAENYFGFPAPIPLFIAQMRQESGFNPNAQSVVGAKGLFQFMPATAAWAAETAGFKPAAPFDANWSIKAGIWYMRYLHDHIKGATECDHFLFDLSAYNGGIARVYSRQNMSTKPE